MFIKWSYFAHASANVYGPEDSVRVTPHNCHLTTLASQQFVGLNLLRWLHIKISKFLTSFLQSVTLKWFCARIELDVLKEFILI